jgi:hypothetical protein
VVLVHGWGGSAQGTWKKFPAIVQEGQVKKFAKADFYYFGYDFLVIVSVESSSLDGS